MEIGRIRDHGGVKQELVSMSEQHGVNLWDLSDLCTPWCLHVAVTLRIAEHLEAGTEQISDLAMATGCDAYALHRVLTHLVGKGVFEEPSPGRFALNEAAQGLLDPALRLGLDLEGIGGRMAHAWGTLPGYVRTGSSAYHERFGLSFWEDLDAHPAIGASFDALMGPTGHGAPDVDFEITGGWACVRTVVDVGGGSGALLAAILCKWPELRGTLVDVPRTIAVSAETFQVAGVADRVTMVGQNFFDPLPPGGDVYLLKKILDNWPDREAKAILSRCAEAARPHGRVVVLGAAVPDGAPIPLSIDMLLVGGKHRTVAEFRELASAAGLEIVAEGRQPSGHFVFECRPN
jgi:2,7-dihydroxy-5-methyl-1-naphthoate 7-O-methyltransferase